MIPHNDTLSNTTKYRYDTQFQFSWTPFKIEELSYRISTAAKMQINIPIPNTYSTLVLDCLVCIIRVKFNAPLE